MKKILLSLMTIGAVGVMVVGATGAFFADTENVAGNTISAGSVDLQLGESTSLPFNVSNIKPGDTGQGKINLKNVGTLDGNLKVAIANYVDLENTCIEPEITAGDPCGNGDLGLGLQMALFIDADKDGSYNQANGDIELEYSGNTNTTSGLQFANTQQFVGDSWTNVKLLTPNSDVDLVVNWRLPETWDYPKSQEIMMTDSVVFDMPVTLNQTN